ncbi:MAG TPA: hypothetical protein VI197_19065, partial [Polyangiaceae bacterium]
MARDLDRWSADPGAPGELQELLRSARTDVPSARDLSGLEAKLGSLLDAPPAPAAHPEAAPQPTTATGSGVPGLTKLAVLVAVGGLIGGGVYLSTRSASEPRSAPVPSETIPARDVEPAPKPESPRAEPEATEAVPSASIDAAAEVAHEAPKQRAQAAAKPSEAALLNQA